MNSLRLRVLLIEDDEDDYVLVKNLLSEVPFTQFELDWVRHYDDALREVDGCRHDVYLLDYRLGERDGLELLREAIARGCEVPIILLTGQGTYETDMEAMRLGAADYLVKDQIRADLLERSIRYALDRQRAREALRRSEQQFRMLVETMNEGLGVQDGNGAFVYVNNKLCEMMGYSREELIGSPVASLFDETNMLLLQNEMARRRLGERASYEIELLTKDGRKIPALIASSPLFDETGEFKGGIAVITDVSVLKECQRA